MTLRIIDDMTPVCFPFLLGATESTPLNMATAYPAIANGGLKREPIYLHQVYKGIQPLVVDSSHAHSRGVLDATEQLRTRLPDARLLVGNVATRAGAQALIDRGVDELADGG